MWTTANAARRNSTNENAIDIQNTGKPAADTAKYPTKPAGMKVGPNFSKFRSPSAFASWLGLCPDNNISGGKVLWAGTRKVNNRAAKAFRLAASALHHSHSALGNHYRRMRAKL